MTYQLILGDCLEELPKIESNSIDAIFSDPPYPYIKRDYGYWTEETWFPMMHEVVKESKRILKPTGSAVFVLQPNSEKVGQVNAWLWKFLVWCCEEWNIIQDVYWWNYTTMPTIHVQRKIGLMRPSVKYCLWLGNPSCYREQSNILWDKGEWASLGKLKDRMGVVSYSSGHHYNPQNMLNLAKERNGVTPYNLLPVSNNSGNENKDKHSATVPMKLIKFWLCYICKPEGTVLDMFSGTGTTGVAARRLNLNYIGIEKIEKYHKIAEHRLETALDIKLDKQTQQLRENTEMLF